MLVLVIFDAVHNSTDYTVLYSTATISIGGGSSGLAYPVVYGLPYGNYSETIFTTSFGGTEVSPVTSMRCVI